MFLQIHPVNPESRKVKQAAEALLKGSVLVIPTDTIYALACDLYQYKAFEQICRIKEVKPDKANFSVLFDSLKGISSFTRPFDRNVYKLLNRCLPGPYTFILEAGNDVPSVFRSKKKTIGVRIPDNRIVHALMELTGHPLVATSIHDPDEIREYPTDPEIIREEYSNRVDLIIDGGTGRNLPSTVIDCTGSEPVLIREGAGDISVIQ